MPKTTIKTYETGKYLTNDTSVFLQVVGVIKDGVLPIYAISSPKNEEGEVSWLSQYEIEQMELKEGKPDFEAFARLKPGDMLRMGQAEDRAFVQVLARVDDIVLLSGAPNADAPKALKAADDLSEQIERLTKGEVKMNILNEQERQHLRRAGSGMHASKVASTWRNVNQLALMNWHIIREE